MDCQAVLKLTADAYLEREAERDPSTAGTVQAAGVYTQCLLERAEGHLKRLPTARSQRLRAVHKSTNDILLGQWRIHGASGGSMFTMFMATQQIDAAALLVRLADPAQQTGKYLPQNLAQEESAALTKASAKLRAFLPVVKQYTETAASGDEMDKQAAAAATAGFKEMTTAWEAIANQATSLTSLDRLRIYKCLDAHLDPDWPEEN